ncbi:MAG: hypothetical protein KCHDKBKB_01306 [Elusimicrobia bacterium]|nr:hypothetical protein [Elusimicrobiota bacterium]
MNAEQTRLEETRTQKKAWKMWGPYLSERQWGTVREDYSDNGDAWNYFPHDHARSRAYHWGEDGLAGISDEKQRLCFALALWNEKDPIIKERLFGLTNSEGNHGEDAKEYYFYLDSTPTHSYMKYLYKYPQAAYPYDDLVRTNRQRSKLEAEYELLDTGVFNEDKYWDVFVEYAKEGPDNILVKITVHNRGSQEASLHVIPHLWFRNTWSWDKGAAKPNMKMAASPKGTSLIAAKQNDIGDYFFYCEGEVPLLFTENETNVNRLYGQANQSPYVKDSINNYFIKGDKSAVNPARTGSKAAADYLVKVKARSSKTIRLRLSKEPQTSPFGPAFEKSFEARQAEAEEFYNNIIPKGLSADQKMVYRQALAGMLWSKQYFYYDVKKWLKEHGDDPFKASNRAARNRAWYHMVNDDVISMPDKWEYPWYAAWDLAFHTQVLALVDIDFAKQQLDLMLGEVYLHPNGQIPAYEWNFGDVNPPVHAVSTLTIYRLEKERTGKGDLAFLKDSFNKLLMNFTWWVNRKDRNGKNAFEGGFLGMDNIGVFDRSSPLPTGGHLEQADGTAWMALFSQNMLEIASELALHDPTYESMVLKFAEHFLSISAAMDQPGDQNDKMWDDKDGFFYDVLCLPSGQNHRLKIRSMVGFLPLCAASLIEPELRNKFPRVLERIQRYFERHPEVKANNAALGVKGVQDRRILTIVDEKKLRKLLAYLLDENEFLSPYGIRALSKIHEKKPYVFYVGGQEYRVDYVPGDSNTGMFGGNSNWRGPIWMPVNQLILRALRQNYLFYGDSFKVECPTGSGKLMTLYEVSEEISRRLANIFLRDKNGRRPVHGQYEKFQSDPHWKDLILYYEYFHGDTGAGIGASHQTGWTGLVAQFLHVFGAVSQKEFLKEGAGAVLRSVR